MRLLKVRQGAIAGVVLSFVLAAAIAGRSADPLPTFGYVLAVALLATVLAILCVAAINRRSQPPKVQ
jgi:peptidoglycan/LPS O-acetylase OafA/YrhL